MSSILITITSFLIGGIISLMWSKITTNSKSQKLENEITELKSKSKANNISNDERL